MFNWFSRSTVTPVLGTLVAIISMGLVQDGFAQAPGESDFTTYCGACHTIGGGLRVGPDLSGVHERRSQDWLEKFVKSSQSLVKSGDADAAAIVVEFNGIVMPDALISDQQIRDVLSYVAVKSASLTPAGGDSAPAANQPAPVAAPASQQDIQTGQELFQGAIRFENGGAACNACHDVRNDAVIGGGVLAAELTTVFSRMGGAGVKAILGQAPFPVMQAAYVNKPLTDDEVSALVAFLQYADSEEYNQLPRDYGIGLFLSGVVGAAILFLIFGLIWRKRKIGSVNQAIYDRQATSVIEDRP
jgi:mono/diheme cytochrome c family protein